ncbi:hypothetical protein SELMODRAFT_428056 [Selaginella moellendorffii]|uniref:Uncharacterized protein n=1 Tax=Selaginella moellendorffii TaxID=88036 RepID=D8T1K0_SELML|nr:hypothetical protein SELMODRAFT_428056 [Selaginella moellendorffii]
MKLNMACHKINMLNQFAFQAYTLVHDIEHLWFIGMLSLEELAARKGQELQTWYQLPLDFLVVVWVKELHLLGPSQHLAVKQQKMLRDKDGEVYITGVLQKLLTRGKKLGMYEPEFYCPCTHEKELCLWYLELVEQMPTSDFELNLYLKCYLDFEESSHQSSRRTKTFFSSLPTAKDNDLEELSSAAMHKQAQHIFQALKVMSSFMTYEGVVVMILPHSLMWEGLLAHLVDNDDGFVEFSSGCLLSSMAMDAKVGKSKRSTLITHNISVHMLDLDDMDDHMDRSEFHLPIYAKCMAQHYIQHEPIVKTKRLVRVEPIIYMSLWNTLNT